MNTFTFENSSSYVKKRLQFSKSCTCNSNYKRLVELKSKCKSNSTHSLKYSKQTLLQHSNNRYILYRNETRAQLTLPPKKAEHRKEHSTARVKDPHGPSQVQWLMRICLLLHSFTRLCINPFNPTCAFPNFGGVT